MTTCSFCSKVIRRDHLARHQRESCRHNPAREEKTPCPVCSKTFIHRILREHIRKHDGVNVEELLANMKLPAASRKRTVEKTDEGPNEKRSKPHGDDSAGIQLDFSFYY